MVVYNFKSIKVVPEAMTLVDVCLSRTQRKTPTVVHKRYQMSRIREFYMRKVKFAQGEFADRLKAIIDDFPRLDSIHPFYADLINVLYDRDHYKLALGQLNVARNLIERVGKDYAKLLKFGDSLYRCKLLKKAALGRMCTVMKKHKASLAYLEQVRQHLSRLPSIDPKERTLLITGYPNCGKSSFINKITRADVEVQPYAFTTKSLYVGHTDYKYLRWQVIDSPGILDHPLEERNTIEMQAITALAHLQATILFFIDISGHSNYSIKQQVSLFESLKALYAGKPVIVVCSKTDIRSMEELDAEERALIEDIGAPVVGISNMTLEGVMDVRNQACDLLMAQRVESKVNSTKVNAILNRIHVAQPTARDGRKREVCIPESVLAKRAGNVVMEIDAAEKRTIKQVEEENGGAGVYTFNNREHWELENDEWKYDDIPEVFLGKNVADYYDADIEERLAALEAEEEQILLNIGGEAGMDVDDDAAVEEAAEIKAFATVVRHKRKVLKQVSGINKTQNKPMMPRFVRTRTRTPDQVDAHFSGLGLDNRTLRGRSREVHAIGGKKRNAEEAGMDVDGAEVAVTRSRSRSQSVIDAIARNKSRSRSESSFRDPNHEAEASVLKMKKQRKLKNLALRGESDRHIPDFKPKHLFSGKRGIGKTDRR